jgi:prolyl-tRNA editing enzyme YbaK/EbsC (Cys-tRNA(Pro) deacylase)
LLGVQHSTQAKGRIERLRETRQAAAAPPTLTPVRFGRIVSRVSQEPDAEQRTGAILDALGLAYELIRIDPDFADTAAFCERYGYPADHAGNTILVASKKEPKQHAACVVLATTRLDVNHAVRDLMGASKLSFASAEEMAQLTGMKVGGVTVFGLPATLPIFVDERVMALDYVILGSGGRNGKIKIAPEVFRRLPGSRIVPGLALPR